MRLSKRDIGALKIWTEKVILVNTRSGFRSAVTHNDYITSIWWWCGVSGGENMDPGLPTISNQTDDYPRP